MASPDSPAPTNGNNHAERRVERADALRRYVETFFAHHGAVVKPIESAPDTAHIARAVEVELEGALREAFGRTSLRLSLAPGNGADVEVAVPGSRVFDRMLALIKEQGDVAWVPLSGVVSAPSSLPEGAGLDGELGAVPAVNRILGYDLELALRVVFIADERHEELALILVPAFGEPRVLERSEVGALVEAGLVGEAGEDVKGPTKKYLKERLEVGLAWLESWAQEAAKPREQVIYEQLSREVQRLTHYYGELIAENENNDEIREQLAADLDRRLAEEVANHRLGVQIELLAYSVIARPQVSFGVEASVGGQEVEAEWRVDLATDTLLSPGCGSCDEDARQAFVCEGGEAGAAHLACEACFGRCAACGVGVCSEHGLVTCHIGEESLCSTCGPRCTACGKPTRRTRMRTVEGAATCEECR